jgi:hypothetical protein
MNPICRLTAAVAGLAGALLAFAAVAPAALARPFPPRPPGWDKHPPLPLGHVAGIHVVGGMPGWQIALIAIGAALLAASAAAGIIAKRGGSPVRRPRAKMSASAPPAGPPGTFRATGPSPAAARTRRHMPPRRRPRPRPVLAIGEEHRVPGRQETTHVHTHSPPGTLPAGSSATGRRATVPARRGPFFRNRRVRFFTLALRVLFLVIFALVFTGTAKVAGGSIGTSLCYVPGIITLAIISAASGNPAPRPRPLLLHT